ncbi:MAG: helix-turn-helix domain-containing protein [Erysipelotrichaceae bacterium]|nr:helix-turn-helix domain-containing protein [Erysipelotrichaceae bacterium]
MPLSSSLVPVDAGGRETKEHGTVLFPAAAYNTTMHYSIPWHWHTYMEAGILQKGSVRLLTEGHVFIIHEGEGFFLNADALHAFRRNGKEACEMHSVVFAPRIVAGSMESVYWQNYVSPLLNNRNLKTIILKPDTDESRQILQDIRTAWENTVQEPAGFEFTVRNALSDAVFRIRSRMEEHSGRHSSRDQRDEARIRMMLAYIEDHFHEEITLEDIAASAAVSVNECMRCFHRTVQTSPVQYVRQLRIQKAAALLRTTDLKINEAAAACGFLDMSYFSRIFRSYAGVTPTEYRKTSM